MGKKTVFTSFTCTVNKPTPGLEPYHQPPTEMRLPFTSAEQIRCPIKGGFIFTLILSLPRMLSYGSHNI